MTISERIAAARRERRVLVSARAEGISIRTLATAIGLSPSRVHRLVAVDLARVAVIDRIAADLDELARPGGSRTWTLPRCSPVDACNAVGGRPSLTWKFRVFCSRKGLPASSTLQLERVWDAWQAE